MALFLGAEGKQEIKAAIVKLLEELQLEPDDLIYFHVEKKSNFDALVDAWDHATFNCIKK